MNKLKLLGYSIIALQIATAAIAATSVYTNLTSFMGSLSGGGEGNTGPIRLENRTDPATGAQKLTIKVNMQNRGLLEILAIFRLRALTQANQVIKEEMDAQRISPGASKELAATVTMSKEEWEKFQTGTSNISTVQLSFEVRSFFDLIGFGASVNVPALR